MIKKGGSCPRGLLPPFSPKEGTMKKIFLFLGIWALMMAPVVMSAAETTADPLMGAVEFGSEGAGELVWKSGRLHSIDADGAVIDDLGYRFASNVKFYGANGTELTRQNFFPGTTVKFVLGKDLRTILSLVKIK
jgi:hypothetical protein